LRTLPDFRSQVHNAQCQWIGGTPDYDNALAALSKDRWIIDRHDRLNAILAEIARQFTWPLPKVEHVNVAAEPYYSRVCTPEIERLLRKINGEDQRLVDLFD
jgi:hypothetical protein